MGQLLKAGYNTHYATGSRAFTETLRRVVGPRGTPQFRYFNSYTEAARNDVDVLICDESHRIRKTSNSRFTAKARRSGVSQIAELLQCSKVAVFLIDDHQVVRPDEIGSASYIREAARNSGCLLHDYELDIQFRCGGSEAFINWVNNTLQITRTPNILFRREEQSEFEFRIFASPAEMEEAIRRRAEEGYSARVTAGFCWPWSEPTHEGFLVTDVAVGSYERPWNAKPEAAKLDKSIPKSHFWATDPNGIDQVGCVYTAQGFEFDYVGVIFGTDLVFDPDQAIWNGTPSNSYDSVVKRSGSNFTDLVKHTYRVLLTRGLKGCYVYFTDKNTERFFRSRLE
jgi:uncharacterized protein